MHLRDLGIFKSKYGSYKLSRKTLAYKLRKWTDGRNYIL